MKRKYIFIIGIIMLLVLVSVMIIRKQRKSVQQPPLPFLDASGKSPLVSHIKTLTSNGGRVDWSPKGDLIAFDRLGENEYYDVWVMKPDGTEQKCLTCGSSQLPKHNGTPAYHPSGNFIAFQSQDSNLQVLPVKYKLIANFVTSPGGAINNNLWIMEKDGKDFWQMTHIKDGMAVLHPHFSEDGNKIIWAEKVSLQANGSTHRSMNGEWEIAIADFTIVNGIPTLSNLQKIKPGDFQLYETHGFFHNDQEIIFSAIKRGLPVSSLDIVTYNLETRDLRLLTDSPTEWDEHAQVSPDEFKIIWVSSQGIDEERDDAGYIKSQSLKLDFWQMNLDGSDPQRLTYFNDPTAPEYIAEGIVSADASFSPDDQKLVAKIRPSAGSAIENEMVILIEFNP